MEGSCMAERERRSADGQMHLSMNSRASQTNLRFKWIAPEINLNVIINRLNCIYTGSKWKEHCHIYNECNQRRCWTSLSLIRYTITNCDCNFDREKYMHFSICIKILGKLGDSCQSGDWYLARRWHWPRSEKLQAAYTFYIISKMYCFLFIHSFWFSTLWY